MGSDWWGSNEVAPFWCEGRPVKRLLRLDWETIAGVVAALAALVLHFLHVVEEGVLLAVILVLLALLLIRDFRRENQSERTDARAVRTEMVVRDIQSALTPPDCILIGPTGLRSIGERLAKGVQGEMLWFNVCLYMFRAQQPFDMMLRPAIENPRVTSIQFISDNSEKELWQSAVMPKVAACQGGNKVKEPLWRTLKEPVSFISTEAIPDGKIEALLSFWGEPFMARTASKGIPRYIFYIKKNSELVPRLMELERSYRIHSDTD